MISEAQEKYLLKIPEDALAEIKPWDPAADEFAKRLLKQMHSANPELEILWSGSLALGISGQNDVDLTMFAEPEEFEKNLLGLISVLGEPQIKTPDKILWRIRKDGYKVDAYLGSKNSEEIKFQIQFFQSLKSDPKLVREYEQLKEGVVGLSAREYQRRKCEFYNKVLGLA